MGRVRASVALAAVAGLLAGGAPLVATGAEAATGCRVSYSVSSQWGGGFVADLAVTNLGDAVNGWALTWSYAGGQTVTSAWNATVTQAGAAVTATSAAWNAALPTGGSASFGLQGGWTGANPAPAAFALNGVTCTGATTPGTTTTRSTTTSTTAGSGGTLPRECSGGSPIVCHFPVQPGNYDVAVVFGGSSAGNTTTTVEARRQVLPAVVTAAGAATEATVTVNVRQPEGQPTGQGGTGTPGLDITFGGPAPRVRGLTVTAAKPRMIFLAGDSTVCDQPTAPYTGWGQILPASVKAGAAVANYADSGESSGSFLSNSALFPTMRPLIASGDLVLIQFGHNDKTTTAATFRGNLTSMVTQVKARGGQPVLVTPPVRRLFSGSTLTATALHVNSVGVNLPDQIKQVGAAEGVPVIDLTARSRSLVESLGPSGSERLYLTTANDGVADNTHFSVYGATQMSGLVISAARDLGLPLVQYLR